MKIGKNEKKELVSDCCIEWIVAHNYPYYLSDIARFKR
jgi:hypothetical protein